MESAVAGVKRAIASIDLALKEEHYVRPSRQRPVPPPQTGSCSHCKRNKAKCDGRDGQPCSRCTTAGLADECEYPIQARPGRKQGVNKRSLLLHEARRELVGVLQQLDPSSTPVAESPSTSTGVPSTTPPAMPPLIAPPAPLPAFGDPSPSTSTIPLPPPPLPTFGAPSLSSSLNTFSPISSASNLPLFPAPVTSAYQVPSPDIVLRTDALDGIDNPLAVLAHVSLHDRGNADDFTYAMKEESELISKAERFYSTGLYTAIDDSEGQLDPVTMGLLTDRDLRRLVNLYFAKLRPFFFHFSSGLHTPDFFRNVSPFLCSAFAYIVATYCPESAHLVSNLRRHTDMLSLRVLDKGFKSPEIVQAYLLLSHWAPAAESWCQDRSWFWLGEGLRIATEINMSRELSDERINDYRARTPLTPAMVDLLRESTSRTWHLLWSGNLMLSVHTGRILGKSFIGGLRSALPAVEPSDPNYMFSANEILNRIFANALNLSSRLQDKPLPDSYGVFNRSWRLELEQWIRDWPALNHFLWIRYWNVRIMLLSLSLKFGPPTRPVLEEVSAAALATLGKVNEWSIQGEAIVYASNSAITNIAYGATILLKIISSSDPTRDPRLKTVVLELCSKVVDTLFRIGNGRANADSMATLQAARMASLLRTINPMPTPAPLHYAISQSAPLPLDLPFSFPSPSGTTSNLPAFDFSGGDFQGFGDTSNFFEDLSSSNLLSLMGQQDQDMAWAGLGHGGGDWPLEGGLEFGTSG